MKFDITINTDDNYLQHCVAMLCSLYENNSEHDITVHVLSNSLDESSRDILCELTSRYNNHVIFYSVDETKLEGVQFRKKRPLTKAAYYRLLLCSVLPSSVERVLYLDCDIIVLRDVSEIFNIELDQYALAATLDHFPYSEKHRQQLHMSCGEHTFCSGVMLINLKYWRDNNAEEKLLEYAHRHRDIVYLHDQDVLNYCFKGKWFVLPPKWNHVAGQILPNKSIMYKDFDYIEYLYRPMLIHYAAPKLKPWVNVTYPDSSFYHQYLTISGFQRIILKHISFKERIHFLKFSAIYRVKLAIAKRLYKDSVSLSSLV